MRSLIFCLALTISGAAVADDLAEANKALAAKSYPQALKMFDQLAATGNPEAQLRLGEMYWYGEGVALDRAKGDALFAQAAAAGNQEAVAARTLSARRAQRAADIAYWTAGYDGADLNQGKYKCTAPVIPEVSKTNADIKDTSAAYHAWQACNAALVANLQDAMPPGKRLPADIAVLLSEQEVVQAKTTIDKVFGAVMDKTQADATAVIARRDSWEKATVAYVGQQNLAIEARNKQVKLDLEMDRRLRDTAAQQGGSSMPRTK